MAKVSVLAFDGMTGFTGGIVTEIFGTPPPEPGLSWYDLAICAESPGAVRTVGGARLETPYGLDVFAAADTVIVPGVPDVAGDVSTELVAALRLAHRRGARLVSVCTGAFALAAAGLLDGRRATTHWADAARLQQRYPRIDLDPNVLYVDDGDLLTSAGHAAGLDLCLHIVRTDHGAAIANRVARRLVIQPYRDGGQAQFIESPVAVRSDDDRIAASMEWALRNLSGPITVESLARQANVSARTYLRDFHRSTGTTPIRWLIGQRIQASLTLLEISGAPIEEIASAVGFTTAVTFRHHFATAMHTSPSAYRQAFNAKT